MIYSHKGGINSSQLFKKYISAYSVNWSDMHWLILPQKGGINFLFEWKRYMNIYSRNNFIHILPDANHQKVDRLKFEFFGYLDFISNLNCSSELMYNVDMFSAEI